MNAEFVRDIDGFTGTAKLWRVDPPVKFGDEKSRYVITSATVAMFSGPETYIFPANEDGEILSWLELDGSYRGGLDHDRAIRALGEAT